MAGHRQHACQPTTLQSPLNKIVLILRRACGVIFERESAEEHWHQRTGAGQYIRLPHGVGDLFTALSQPLAAIDLPRKCPRHGFRSRHRPKQPEAPGARHAEPARDAPATPARSVFGGRCRSKPSSCPRCSKYTSLIRCRSSNCRTSNAERVRAGLSRARSEGKRLGLPPIALALEKRIREALAAPRRPGVRVIAKQFGVDPGTVQRISRPFDRVGVVVA